MLDKTNRADTKAGLQAALMRLLDDARLLGPDRAKSLDREVRSVIARLTRGMSPVAVVTAYVDWLGHLAVSPGKFVLLAESLVRKGLQLGLFSVRAMRSDDPEGPVPVEARMRSEAWQKWPFNVFAQGHALARTWVAEATSGVEGMGREREQFLSFLARQVLELVSPANFPLINPEVLSTTKRERGANLVRGGRKLADDLLRPDERQAPAGTGEYRVGETLAITPGKVVLRNDLIELIQYEATTEAVGAEPVLIIPAWIMKYYILDLSPRNSLVRYLVDQGKTVFVISWKNPTEADRDLGMDDYLKSGVMEALTAINAIVPSVRIHAVGYCLGGTLLAIAAAYMAREGDDRLKTVSTFASQIDFTEAGEIGMFLGDSVFSFLETLMWKRGYLRIEDMVGAFRSLRVTDLVYEPAVKRYLLGSDRSLNDLLAWNEDGTRMPYRMHSEYLRNCYLENNLAECRYEIDRRPVCVGDIRLPAFVLGTKTDHVAPWKSVYKAHRLMHNELTFVLTTGGHNAGIACGPAHPRRRYQLAVRKPGDLYTDPETWLARTAIVEGSWWSAWNAWLEARMSGHAVPPPVGAADRSYPGLSDAPGRYVLDR